VNINALKCQVEAGEECLVRKLAAERKNSRAAQKSKKNRRERKGIWNALPDPLWADSQTLKLN